MRLIVESYSTFTYVIAVEYESVEALYVHLAEAVQRYVNALEAEDEILEKVRRQREDLGAKLSKKEKQAAAEQWQKDNPWPSSPRPTVVVGGAKFDASDFIWRADDGRWITDLPQILTLDEWFEGKLKENR